MYGSGESCLVWVFSVLPGEVSVAGVAAWRDKGMGVVTRARCIAYLWAIFSSFSKEGFPVSESK